MYDFFFNLASSWPAPALRLGPPSLGRISETLISPRWLFLPQKIQRAPVSSISLTLRSCLPTSRSCRSYMRALAPCAPSGCAKPPPAPPLEATFPPPPPRLRVVTSLVIRISIPSRVSPFGWNFGGETCSPDCLKTGGVFGPGSNTHSFLPFTSRHPLAIVQIMGYPVRNVVLLWVSWMFLLAIFWSLAAYHTTSQLPSRWRVPPCRALTYLCWTWIT